MRLLIVNAIDKASSSAPGTKPISSNTCAPLQIPNTGFPVLACAFRVLSTGSNEAIIPARDRSSYENPPTITKPSHCANFFADSFHKNGTASIPTRLIASIASRSQLEPGNCITAILHVIPLLRD